MAAPITVLVAIVSFAGCSFDARDCTVDTTCPSDHACDSATGICEPLSPDASDHSDTDHPDDAPGADVAPDPTDSADATGDEPDITESHDSGTRDSGPIGGECLDPSHSCGQDQHEPNDDFGYATSLSAESVGCHYYDDELTSFDTNLDASLCADDRDRYKYPVNNCRNRSFIIELYVRPEQECDPRSYVMEWKVDRDVVARCVDPAQDGAQKWQCEDLGGGGKKLAYIVDSEDRQSTSTHLLSVQASDLTDGRVVEFDYQLHARIKR